MHAMYVAFRPAKLNVYNKTATNPLVASTLMNYPLYEIIYCIISFMNNFLNKSSDD